MLLFWFVYRVTLFEDPVYQSLMEKIVAKKSLLKKEFERSDRNQTSMQFLITCLRNIIFFIKLDHISSTDWADIMKDILHIDLPWLNLRSKFVKEDTQGILYNSMLEEYALENAKFQKVL